MLSSMVVPSLPMLIMVMEVTKLDMDSQCVIELDSAAIVNKTRICDKCNVRWRSYKYDKISKLRVNKLITILRSSFLNF